MEIKSAIGWLKVNSIVNEVIRIISGLLFFYEKILNAQKCKSSQNQLTKKNKRTKNNKGNNFLLTKTSKRQRIVYFAFWCFFYAQHLFV